MVNIPRMTTSIIIPPKGGHIVISVTVRSFVGPFVGTSHIIFADG